MRVEQVDVGALTLDPNNARGHDKGIPELVESLEQFGQQKPLVVWRDTVIAGNGLLLAAMRLGWKVVDINRVPDDWTYEKATAYALADNRTAELSEWITPVLDDQISDLTLKGWDMPALGFTDLRLDFEPPPDDDDVPELPVEPRSKLGDVFQLGNHLVTCGDSIELMPKVETGSVHLVATDPPYYRVVDSEWDDQWGADAEAFLKWIASFLVEFDRVMVDRGTVGVFCSPDMSAGIELEMRRVFAVLNHIVWRKPSLGRLGSMDKDTLRRFFPTSERFIIAEKCRNPDGDLFRFRDHVNHAVARDVYAEIREALVAARDAAGLTNRQIDKELGTAGMAGHYFGGSQWTLPTKEAWEKIVKLAGETPMPTWESLRRSYDAKRREFNSRRREFDSRRREFDSARREFDSDRDYDFELLSDVWTFERTTMADRAGHPTQKPLALMEHIVTTMSREGDVVLDPFGGSGSTLIACERLGRQARLFEIDPRYVDVIIARWEELTGKKAKKLRKG